MAEIMMRSHKLEKAGKHFNGDGFLSVKLDGVPGGYTTKDLKSRQGKPLPGVQWIHDLLSPHIPVGWRLWGEHYTVGVPFKDISGGCRGYNQYPTKLHLFNVHMPLTPHMVFSQRICMMQDWYYSLPVEVRVHVVLVDQFRYWNMTPDQLWDMLRLYPAEEGLMWHSSEGLYTPTRSWDSLKIVLRKTYDLKYIGCIEATSATGRKLGMAGKLVFLDSAGKQFSVGPGKLSHDQRRELWTTTEYDGRIAVIAAKGDPTYEALREPTFQHWHMDKTVPEQVC